MVSTRNTAESLRVVTIPPAGPPSADIEHLADASSEHTMDPLAALDEEIAEVAESVTDVLEAVRRLRRLRGLRRAMEEVSHGAADGSASTQELLQETAVLTDLRETIGTDEIRLAQRMAEAESEVAARSHSKHDAVDRLRYLHTLRAALIRRQNIL
jgi:hypothetical protein